MANTSTPTTTANRVRIFRLRTELAGLARQAIAYAPFATAVILFSRTVLFASKGCLANIR